MADPLTTTNPSTTRVRNPDWSTAGSLQNQQPRHRKRTAAALGGCCMLLISHANPRLSTPPRRLMNCQQQSPPTYEGRPLVRPDNEIVDQGLGFDVDT